MPRPKHLERAIRAAGLLLMAGPALADTAAMPVAPSPPPALAAAITVDAGLDRHPISPLIYGVNFATTAVLRDLNAPLNRSGGNSTSMYNWRIDARNAGKDWFFESLACDPANINDQHGDGFVRLTRAADALPMLTIPMIGYVAKLDDGRKPLASYSIGKYGLQADHDANGFVDAGNGLELDGTPITDNDPNDAAIPDDPKNQQAWVTHLTQTFGGAASGGVRYYLMDNEPSLWQLIHRDVHPAGAHAQEIADQVLAYAKAVKAADPGARIVAPEEWGWTGYHYSGFDQQNAVAHGFDAAPDRINQTGGLDYVPWLLQQWKRAGHPVDVVSLHFYPQGGEFAESGGSDAPEIQRLRNRSTRDLWDTSYKDPSWINAVVALIPLLRHWVDTYYDPGTPIALTEYNWGGETLMNGATAQADILGIFGREGLDMATRWATPDPSTPVYKAMKLYRNYDDHQGAFGDTSIAAVAPDADTVSSFAALRSTDGAMTLIVINKQLDRAADVTLTLRHFADHGDVATYRLAANKIARLTDRRYDSSLLADTLPAQSVTLYVLRGAH